MGSIDKYIIIGILKRDYILHHKLKREKIMHKIMSRFSLSIYFLFFLCFAIKTQTAEEKPSALLTEEEIVALKNILQTYKEHKNNPRPKEDLDSIDTNPEQYLVLPKVLTDEQISEKDIFKRFKLTYSGTTPDIMERIISNIDDLQTIDTSSQKVQNSTGFANSLLLYGEPGNGKSYFVEELARATQTIVLSCIGSQLHSSFKHLSTVKVENFFNIAIQQTKPTIVFIDEVDSIAGKQSAVSGSNDNTQTLKTFLVKLDELKKNKNIFIVVATNHPYWLEDAVKSRLSFALEIERPKTWQEYSAFFKSNYKKHNLYDPENSSDLLAALAWKKTAGFLGGDAYSKRDLDTIIPIILDIKKLAYKKDKKYIHPFIRSINIEKDRAFINAALQEVHLNYQKKLVEKTEKEKSSYDKITDLSFSALKFVASAVALKYMDITIGNEAGHFYQKYGPTFFAKKELLQEQTKA